MKTIKKIVALGLGISMVGATLGAVAAAAELNDYPSPFVSGGKFSGTLVVGDKAAAEDVIGVSDIAMSLQFAASVKTGTGAGASTTVEGDAWLVRESGDDLNLYENLNNVTTVIDDQDLDALADGKLRAKTDAAYTQTLTVPQVEVQFTTDDNADVEDPALFLKFPNGRVGFTYKLDFTTPAESDKDTTVLEDFEDEKITLLGKEYTITQASNRTKLTLMSGAVQTTQEVGETKSYNINGKDYEVTVMVVSGDTSATAITKLLINDETTKSLSKDDTYKLNDGIEIGIKEILPTKAGDVQQNLVEFFLGAQKLVLDGSDSTVDIGDETINDVAVTLTTTQTSTVEKLTRIQITWTPTDDYFVPVGGKLSEMVTDDEDYVIFFDKFGVDYSFTGLVASKTEELKIYPSGNTNYKMSFTNRAGVTYDEKMFYYNASMNNNVSLGDSASKPLKVLEGTGLCDNGMFVVEYNKNSRIIQLTDINVGDTTVSLKDLGTGDTSEYSYSEDQSAGSNVTTFSLDGGTYTLNVTNPLGDCLTLKDIAVDSGDTQADLWTQYDTKIALNSANLTTGVFNTSLATIVITEDSDGKDDASTDIDSLYLNFTYNDANTELQLPTFSTTTMSSATAGTVMISLDSDDNTKEGQTQWGTFIRQANTDSQDRWTFTITETESSPMVYMTAGVTTVVSGDAVTGDSVIVQRIDVGATKLASEVAGMEMTQNLLLVGGPCANRAVEAASTSFPTCSGWPLAPGQALIQLVNQADGHVALLVAGTTAADTRAATNVVAKQDKLKALANGVTKQVLTVSTGTLMNWEEPVVESNTQ
ncbi:MAG: hypothetical protein Q7S65_02095 [Nanoarchaeota archaeon]|nr:hypothetical protein [Nanoarchaeota archaeon]